MPAKRGFAAMSPEVRRQIARKGGKAVQEKGTAYRWTREQAAEAGRIGGPIGGKKSKRRPRVPPNPEKLEKTEL